MKATIDAPSTNHQTLILSPWHFAAGSQFPAVGKGERTIPMEGEESWKTCELDVAHHFEFFQWLPHLNSAKRDMIDGFSQHLGSSCWLQDQNRCFIPWFAVRVVLDPWVIS